MFILTPCGWLNAETREANHDRASSSAHFGHRHFIAPRPRCGRCGRQHGLATEPPTSEAYEPDGYWRGPIWAPSTALLVDGLRRSGHGELADLVSDRFRALCERSGFAENFDALSGQGLRDRAYTWTAAVYLVLAAAYVRRG